MKDAGKRSSGRRWLLVGTALAGGVGSLAQGCGIFGDQPVIGNPKGCHYEGTPPPSWCTERAGDDDAGDAGAADAGLVLVGNPKGCFYDAGVLDCTPHPPWNDSGTEGDAGADVDHDALADAANADAADGSAADADAANADAANADDANADDADAANADAETDAGSHA